MPELASNDSQKILIGEKLFSLVIPFYNEEQNVIRVLEDLQGAFARHAIDHYEIIAVNNGSWDKTGELLRTVSERDARVKVVTVPKNRGLGWGVLQGFKAAQGDYVGFNGGDGQAGGEDVVRVFQKLVQDDLDLSKVRRVSRQDGFERRVISWIFNGLCRVLFGIKSPDVNGLPKVMSREALERLDVTSRDWFIDTEIMVKAKQLGFKVGEVETEFLKREGGRSHVNYGTLLEFFKNIILFRLFGVRALKRWKSDGES